MITLIIIGVAVAGLIAGAMMGWKARGWKDEFDAEIDRIFYEALSKY